VRSVIARSLTQTAQQAGTLYASRATLSQRLRGLVHRRSVFCVPEPIENENLDPAKRFSIATAHVMTWAALASISKREAVPLLPPKPSAATSAFEIGIEIRSIADRRADID
jgi:hypothetical protein